MSETANHKRQVAKEVLRLLADYSPLTIEMLARMSRPPIAKKNLRQAIGILRRRGLVDMVAGDSQTFYYQLHQARRNRQVVAAGLGESQPVKARPLLRKQDWRHNEWCEFWSLIIKRSLPDVQIVREHDVDSHSIAQAILLNDGTDLDLIPDLLLIFPATNGSQKVSIAFEIERTRKSDKRILRKLRKYVYETHLDGLIYVCDSGRLSETIRLLYQKKTLERAHKKRGYANNFFLFSDSMSAGADLVSSFYNSEGQRTFLDLWINTLRSTKTTLRRDSEFKHA